MHLKKTSKPDAYSSTVLRSWLLVFLVVPCLALGVWSTATPTAETSNKPSLKPVSTYSERAPSTRPSTTVAPTSTVHSVPPTALKTPPTEKPHVTTTIKPVPTATRPVTSTTHVAASDSNSGSAGVNAFLACVRNRESRGNYQAVNPTSGAGGAYQFMPSTWAAMGFAGRYGVAGAQYASPAQQDEAAMILYNQAGTAPWGGSCG